MNHSPPDFQPHLPIISGFHNSQSQIGHQKEHAGAANHVFEKPDATCLDDQAVREIQARLIPDFSRDEIVFKTPFTPGDVAEVEVIGATAGFLNTWIDFNGQGSFTNAVQLTIDWRLHKGTNSLLVDVPESIGQTVRCRFCFSSTPIGGASAPEGIWDNVEVLDRDLGAIIDVISATDAQRYGTVYNLPVYLQDQHGAAVCDSSGYALSTRTDTSGRYAFYGLPDAEYRIAVGTQLRLDGQHAPPRPDLRPAAVPPTENAKGERARGGNAKGTRTDGPQPTTGRQRSPGRRSPV